MNHVTQRCFWDLGRLRFLTLQCRQSAPSGGGESVLVSGADLVAALSNEELRTLMQPGMVSMGRRPAGDGSWMKVSSIPLFWVDKDSGWLQVRWRCNDGCLGDVAEEVKPSYEQMDAVARKEARRGSRSIVCLPYQMSISSFKFGGASAGGASGAGGDPGYRQSCRRARPKALRVGRATGDVAEELCW